MEISHSRTIRPHSRMPVPRSTGPLHLPAAGFACISDMQILDIATTPSPIPRHSPPLYIRRRISHQHTFLAGLRLAYRHITALTFEDMGSFHFEDLPPMWKRLLRSVSSLEKLSIRWGVDSEQLPFPWRERHSFRHLTTLRHLQLTSVQFKSLSSLFRVLGEMKFLEVLQLWRVWWGEDTGVTDGTNGASRALSYGKAPCLRTPLRPIKLTETFQCTNDKAFGHLYARRAVEYSPRHPHGRSDRKSVLSEHCAPPAEFWIILQLIDLLAPAGDDSLMFSEIRDDEGQS